MSLALVRNFLKEEDGQDLVEYALLLGLVALAATTFLGTFTNTINGLFTNVNTKLNAAS